MSACTQTVIELDSPSSNSFMESLAPVAAPSVSAAVEMVAAASVPAAVEMVAAPIVPAAVE
eukprot:1713465-Alexandrium_andersonii.AAC.1